MSSSSDIFRYYRTHGKNPGTLRMKMSHLWIKKSWRVLKVDPKILIKILFHHPPALPSIWDQVHIMLLSSTFHVNNSINIMLFLILNLAPVLTWNLMKVTSFFSHNYLSGSLCTSTVVPPKFNLKIFVTFCLNLCDVINFCASSTFLSLSGFVNDRRSSWLWYIWRIQLMN